MDNPTQSELEAIAIAAAKLPPNRPHDPKTEIAGDGDGPLREILRELRAIRALLEAVHLKPPKPAEPAITLAGEQVTRENIERIIGPSRQSFDITISEDITVGAHEVIAESITRRPSRPMPPLRPPIPGPAPRRFPHPAPRRTNVDGRYPYLRSKC